MHSITSRVRPFIWANAPYPIRFFRARVRHQVRAVRAWVQRAAAWMALYVAAMLGGFLFALWVALGGVKIYGLNRIPRRGRMLIAPNHPGMLEPLLLGLLFNQPFPSLETRGMPWSTPDKSNFFDRWYWGWARLRSIPFDRKSGKASLRALGMCSRVLRAGFRLVFFGEGGRTSSAPERVYSPSGYGVRPFKDGIGRMLLEQAECAVVPIWVEGTDVVIPRGKWFPRFWRARITITIGKPWHYERPTERLTGRAQKEAAHVLTEKIQQLVLQTAEETKLAVRGRRRKRRSSRSFYWVASEYPSLSFENCDLDLVRDKEIR